MCCDYLPYINKPIKQIEGLFKVNTDTVNLGKFIDIKHKDEVLDIGTNNGALLLYASFFEPKSLTGIDIIPEAISVAEENMRINNVKANLICTKLQDYDEGQYDVIICNPPYFKSDANFSSNRSEEMLIARNDDYLPLDDLLKGYQRLLKETGHVFMIYRANRLQELIFKLKEYKLRIKRMQLVYDEKTPYAITVLLEIVKGKATDIIIEKPINL